MVENKAQTSGNTDLEVLAARLVWSELNSYTVAKHYVTDAVKATSGIVVLDAKGVCDAPHNSSSTALGLTEKRSGIELMGLKDSIEEHDSDLWRCYRDMTKKKMAWSILSSLRAKRLKWVNGSYRSAKKRWSRALAWLGRGKHEDDGNLGKWCALCCITKCCMHSFAHCHQDIPSAAALVFPLIIFSSNVCGWCAMAGRSRWMRAVSVRAKLLSTRR